MKQQLDDEPERPTRQKAFAEAPSQAEQKEALDKLKKLKEQIDNANASENNS